MNEKTIVKVSAGVFHNRVTLNDSLLLGGNPPFQPQVSVSNGSVDNPGGAGGAAARCRFGMTAIDPVFKHPVAYTYSAGVQRELPWGFVVDATYVGRQGRNLQRERNINQLAAGTIQAQPGVNSGALRPYKGYGVIRLVGERGPLRVQRPAARRRSPLQERLQVRRRLHARPLEGQRQRQARRAVQHVRRLGLLGQLELRSPSRVQLLLHLRPAVLQRTDTSLTGRVLGGWQISGSTFMRTGTPLWVTRGDDIAGVGDTFAQPYEPGRRSVGRRQRRVLRRARRGSELLVQSGGVRAPAAGTFGNAPRNEIYNPGQYQWDIALFKNVAIRSGHTAAVPRGDLQLPEPRELEQPDHRSDQHHVRPRSRARTTRAATSS